MIRVSTRLATLAASTALLLATPGCATSDAGQGNAPVSVSATATQAPAPIPGAGPALWKVADEDTTIYLFGTVHALPRDIVWYKGTVAQALDSSDTLVTEVIMDQATQGKMQQVVLSTATLPQGQSLRAMLTAEQKPVYEAGLAKMGMPPEAFDRFEPWYAALMFSMIPLMQQGYERTAGVEHVLEQASAGTKERGQLETIEYQLGLFDALPMDAQLAYMMETVTMMDEIKPSLDAMVAEWLEGDSDALAAMMNESLTQGELVEALLYRRNRAWAEWVDTRLDAPGTVFVAVGAGHLAGKESVQDVLARRGVTVTRVQ